MSEISRRALLGGAAGALSLPSIAGASAARRSLRIAHMTDFHVQPELHAAKGMEAALIHCMAQRPDMILGGGDLVMDAYAQTESRAALQWSIFNGLMKSHVQIPVHHTIGNHDVWGWNTEKSQTTGSEAKWGKKWFLDNFGYADTHYSFDQSGWHFVVLDNIWRTPDGYNGIVGPEQREWLADDLSKTKLPTLVISHIPLLSVTALVDAYKDSSGEWTIGGSEMTKDLAAIQKIFEANKQVKIALSGHMHTLDRVDWKGVSYLCGGAVCGNWWKGPLEGFEPGYRTIDLYSDGSFSDKYHAWGWDESYLRTA